MMNRKGIFFTLMSIVFIGLFLASYTFYDDVSERKGMQSRVSTMHGHLDSMEKDMQRVLYVAGYRSIYTMEKKIIELGNFEQNVSLHVQELFFNASYNGAHQQVMEGATFDDMTALLTATAGKINANLTLSSPDVIISQDDPWRAKLTMRFNLTFFDISSLALWNRTEEIVSYIPLENFDDPFFLVKTNGKINRKFNKTILSFGGSSTNVTLMMQQGQYIADNLAPSFLQRLEGKTSASAQGASSLINIDELSLQGLSAEDKSIVDHIYFSSSNPTAYHVQGTVSWLKLDNDHAALYNVSGILE